MSYFNYGGNDFSGNLFGMDNFDYLDSYSLLHDYQRRAITGKKEDYNYEYDRFPRNFIYSKNFQGAQSNPYASKLDQLHTESFLTNKVRNIEKVYVGSDEMPEEYERYALPQVSPYKYASSNVACHCSLCKAKSLARLETDDISRAIEELQRNNDILTIILIFVVIYCVVQLLYSRGHHNPSNVLRDLDLDYNA